MCDLPRARLSRLIDVCITQLSRRESIKKKKKSPPAHRVTQVFRPSLRVTVVTVFSKTVSPQDPDHLLFANPERETLKPTDTPEKPKP